MSALGQKQTSRHARVMSVLPIKADIHQRVPFADTIFPYFEMRDVCQLLPADTTVIGWRVLFG
jgi:hypothetical protein